MQWRQAHSFPELSPGHLVLQANEFLRSGRQSEYAFASGVAKLKLAKAPEQDLATRPSAGPSMALLQTQKAMEATSAFGASPHVVLTRVASVASDGGPEAVDRRVHRGSDTRQSCGGRLVDERTKTWPRAQ